MNNKSDGMILEHMGVKEKPPDRAPCELSCSKCLKVKKHMNAMKRYTDSFVSSVKAEYRSLKQFEDLLEAKKIQEANELLSATISLNKKSFILEKLSAELFEQMSELDICSVERDYVDMVIRISIGNRDTAIEVSELLRDIQHDLMKETFRLKIIQQQREAFHMTAEIAEINGRLQNQRETTTNWEYATKLEDKKPKLVRILQKAELGKVDYEWELVEKLNVENFQVIKVIEIYDDFNFRDIYNPSTASLQGVTYNEDVFEPGNKENGQPIGYSWIWSYQADIMQAVCKWNEDCWGNRISPQPWCIIDRGKIHVLYCQLWKDWTLENSKLSKTNLGS